MAEYIEREALLTKALKEKRFVFQMEDLLNNEIVVKTVYSDLAEFVNSIPAADVVGRKRGRWVMKETMTRSPFAKNAYCSECLEETSFHHNFCPNCGARMEVGHETD